MKCEISAPEPYILRDAKPGALFMACAAEQRECVLAVLHPAPPLRSMLSHEVTLIRCVVLACRVEQFEPGHHIAGTMLMLSPETPIQFIEQSRSAKFIAKNIPTLSSLIDAVHRARDEGLALAGEFLKPGDQL